MASQSGPGPRLAASDGIAEEKAPSRNAARELRKVAQSRAAALVKATKARIERDSFEFQGKLLAGALTSEAARALLDELPAVESLMPPLDIAEFKVLGNSSNSALEEDDL